MSNLNISDTLKSEVLNFTLTDDYRSKKFAKKFNNHINYLFDCASTINNFNNTISNDFDFNDKIYWETEAFILENLDDINSNDKEEIEYFDNQLLEIEDNLYDKIISDLGDNYKSSDSFLGKIIDNTVHSTLNSIRFDFFSNSEKFINPWTETKNILIEDSVLYYSSSKTELFDDLGFNLENDSDSDEIKYNKIGIIGKGKREDYNFSSFRDLLKLRKTVLGIIDEKASSSSSPIKSSDIINELRKMGIKETELKDSHIKNWLINPLKRTLKIGSCNEGYFILNNCNDLLSSYNSHFMVLKGYLKTLENHSKLAKSLNCDLNINFNLHKDLL